MLEKSRFTVCTRIQILKTSELSELFTWLNDHFGLDEWHFRVSKKLSSSRAIYFRNEKQQLIFELAWSRIIYQPRRAC